MKMHSADLTSFQKDLGGRLCRPPRIRPPHLQLLLIKVAQPLQWYHFIEAIQEGSGLLFHAAGEPPVRQQAVGWNSASKFFCHVPISSWCPFLPFTWCTPPCFPLWLARSLHPLSARERKPSQGSPCPVQKTAPLHIPPGCSVCTQTQQRNVSARTKTLSRGSISTQQRLDHVKNTTFYSSSKGLVRPNSDLWSTSFGYLNASLKSWWCLFDASGLSHNSPVTYLTHMMEL